MCGIAGFAGEERPERAEEILQAMVAAVAHRGPDAEGTARWPGAWLGHRRLAILDLSEAGRQPMLSADGRVGIVFNGCIYNFREIRQELENRGHSFRSNCDTEVLVEGYREWGIDALVPRLRGMFAFAIWDDTRRTLSLVRDRLGVKPLLYNFANGNLAFASTASALHAAGVADEIDEQAVLEFLEFGYVTEDRTIYCNTSKLAAGSILEWREGRISVRSYWQLPDEDRSSRITFDEAVEETERLLLDSVRVRLCSDVPIGALLSAGVDSTLVCWALTQLNANITAFTVSTPNDPADEAPATVETARRLGIPHHVVEIPAEDGAILNQMTAAYGEPFACSSALGMLRVSAAVKPHATVLLTGDGGDDIYLGYAFHRHYFHIQRIARGLPAAAVPVWRGMRGPIQLLPGLRRVRRMMDYATGGLAEVARAHDGLPFFESRSMLGRRLTGLSLPQRQMEPSMESARNLLGELLQYQRRMWFASEFMTKVDGGTMYHALEARSPFLDHTMWEFAARLPAGLRLKNGVLKAVLREIVRRRVGPDVAARRKQGFTIPVERWLARHWRESLSQIGSRPLLEGAGWIRTGTTAAAVQEAQASGNVPTQLWRLIVLENWLRAQDRATVLSPSLAVHSE